MGIYDLIKQRRSIRKFDQKKIDRALLNDLVDAARLAPSASNMQPLKYIIVDGEKETAKIFKNLKWAGYIAPAGNPGKGEEPVAYIIILLDTEIGTYGYDIDVGAASQNILLAAWHEGIGSCLIGSINSDEIKQFLDISDRYKIKLVVALGYPAEEPVIEDETGSIRYYKEADGVLHVPKRRLKGIILDPDSADITG